MSDNIKRFNAIRKALTKYYPKSPTKRQNRHLTTLAALISGIVASKSTQLPQIATKAPDHAKPESRVKRYSRLLQNENVTETAYFMPFVKDLVEALAQRGPLVLVFDGSTVGRGCITLLACQFLWIIVNHNNSLKRIALPLQLLQVLDPNIDALFCV